MISYAKTAAAIVLFWVSPGVFSACLNDQTYTYNDSGRLRPCSNIRINEDRRQVLCGLSEVRDACPQICGICCDDDPTFTFPLENVDKTKNCEWITKNNVETRRANYCTQQDYIKASATTIRNMCPKACDYCQELVDVGPTKPPTQAPTRAPTKAPTKSPTKAPTNTSTKAPTTSSPPCFDDPFYTFKLTWTGTTVDCTWLTKSADRAAVRMANYCPDTDIKYNGCPATCGGCTSTCQDDPTFTFNLINNPTESRDCAWLTLNLSKATIRKENYCDSVGTSCEKTCGTCN